MKILIFQQDYFVDWSLTDKMEINKLKTMKEQVTDLILSIKEEGITSILESESLKALVTELAKQVTTEETSLLLGSLFGAIAPRVNGIVLSYKQNRFERNTKAMIEALIARIELLERNYSQLNPEMQENYGTQYIEMLLDNVIDERQVEKVKWNVNGFINLMTDESNENIMQMFFDTLSELTVLDIDTLRMYELSSDINITDVVDKYGINYDQVKLVKEKLVRLGLLSRKNDEVRDANLDEITVYLQNLEKDLKKKNPKGVKLSNKVKKISGNESYRITRLGVGFLKSIGK